VKRLWLEGLGVSLCGAGAQKYQYDWKWIRILPGKSEVEMLPSRLGRCQELQFSTIRKAGEHFWNQSGI